LVLKNDEVTLQEVRQLIESGQVQNVVISPGPGNPHVAKDVGEWCTAAILAAAALQQCIGAGCN
jgi:anthranilate/para-aminobenzoate synthase component II